MKVRQIAVLVAALGAPAAARAGIVPELDVRAARACEAEVAAVEARERLAASAPELHADALADARAALDACAEEARTTAGRAEEELALLREVARRVPPREDTPERRAEVERELRVERARAKPPERRTAAERALLDDERARREAEAIERTWSADPRVRRTAWSASLCRAEAEARHAGAELAAVQQVAADRAAARPYALLSRARRAGEVAGAIADALAPLGGALPCSDPLVALVVRCLEDAPPPACGSAEVAAYLRLAR